MEKSIPIPEGVTVEQQGTILTVTGPKGTLTRTFEASGVTLAVAGAEVKITSASDRRKTRALTGTTAAHVRNMIQGVQTGYEARLKAIFSHFPIKVKVEGNRVVVQNFLGERDSRTVGILEGVTVDAKKEEIIITGIDRERVGQTAGRIERIAKVKGFDRRIFQDGIHLIQKARPAE
ncbi:MAG: 50S ribosomal protein L6 [Candidatus Aenigmarchaeota archaeon]|nr:50S ribosomal protein L6 [Candidatus Aenigmarchaeota archaeon]